VHLAEAGRCIFCPALGLYKVSPFVRENARKMTPLKTGFPPKNLASVKPTIFLFLAPNLVTCYNPVMRIISCKKIREFWELHPDARDSLEAWYVDIKNARWEMPSDIKEIYRNASFLAHNRVVFNIKGNKYRLVVVVQYTFKIVFIRFIGTHQEYNEIDAAKI